MNNDIKEILHQLETVGRKHTIEICEDGSKIETMPASVVDELRLNNYSAKLLLDYITNLEEEIKRQEKAQVILDNQNAELYNKLTNLQEKYDKALTDVDKILNVLLGESND